MSTIQDETLQQHAALMGAWEWEPPQAADPSASQTLVHTICRVYRNPNIVYTNIARDAGPIWVAQAIKKPPTDSYEPNWTGADDAAKKQAAENWYSKNETGQAIRKANDTNVKTAHVFTFADAKAKALALAKTFT